MSSGARALIVSDELYSARSPRVIHRITSVRDIWHVCHFNGDFIMKWMNRLALVPVALGVALVVGCETSSSTDSGTGGQGIIKDLNDAGGAAADKVRNAGEKAVDAVKETGEKAGEAIKETGEKAVDAVKDAGERAADAAKEG